MSNILLNVNNLHSATPQGKVLFHDCSFTLREGELLYVAGANGSGKSTLLRILLGKQKLQQGSIERFFSPHEIAYVPQMQNMDFYLPMTLGEVIEISHQGAVDTKTIESISLLRPEKFHLPWNSASGGERQRTLITCVLLQHPRILVLDEPLNHLDTDSHRLVSETVYHFLTSNKHHAVIMASHIEMEHFALLDERVVRVEL